MGREGKERDGTEGGKIWWRATGQVKKGEMEKEVRGGVGRKKRMKIGGVAKVEGRRGEKEVEKKKTKGEERRAENEQNRREGEEKYWVARRKKGKDSYGRGKGEGKSGGNRKKGNWGTD